MAKIYTRTGDSGQTRLANGQAARKATARFEAIGTVDELNAHLGLTLALLGEDDALPAILLAVQNELFDFGAVLAGAQPEKFRIHAERVNELEAEIDRLGADLPPMRSFILPGGSPAGAQLHVARTVCRRAERAVWALEDNSPGTVPTDCLRYLNRLSDLLFTMARSVNQAGGETTWHAPKA